MPAAGPAFSMAGKVPEPKDTMPSHIGPGAYDPTKPLPSAPAFTIAGRPAEPSADADAPGAEPMLGKALDQAWRDRVKGSSRVVHGLLAQQSAFQIVTLHMLEGVQFSTET